MERQHPPRNTLQRAVRTGAEPSEEARQEFEALTSTWGVHPKLAELLDEKLSGIRAS